MPTPDFLEGRVPARTGIGLASGSLAVAELLQLTACSPAATPVQETATSPANLELTQAIATLATEAWRQVPIPLEAGRVGRIEGPIEFVADPSDATGQKLRVLTAVRPDGTVLDANLQYGMATAVVKDTTTGELLYLPMLVQFSKGATARVEAWGLFENAGPSSTATHGDFTVNIARENAVKPTTLTVTTDVVEGGIMVQAREAGGATYYLIEASSAPTTAPTEAPTAVPASPWVDLLVDVLSGAKTVEAAPLESPATSVPTNPPTEAPPTEIPGEAVNVEQLNLTLWWFVVFDQQSQTYKRVTTGIYHIERDANGVIVSAKDASGNPVDALLFEEGGDKFGWEGVEVDYNNENGAQTATLRAVNTGKVVQLSKEINGSTYDITALKILVAINPEEFRVYYATIKIVRNGVFDPDINRTGILITDGNRAEVADVVIGLLTKRENINKDLSFTFLTGLKYPIDWYKNNYKEFLNEHPDALYLWKDFVIYLADFSNNRWPPAESLLRTSEIGTWLH